PDLIPKVLGITVFLPGVLVNCFGGWIVNNELKADTAGSLSINKIPDGRKILAEGRRHQANLLAGPGQYLSAIRRVAVCRKDSNSCVPRPIYKELLRG